VKLGSLLAEARAALTHAGVEDAKLDARLIVEHFSGASHADAIGRPEMPIDAEAVDAIRKAIARRISGEPVHRILGFREFYGLRLALSAETLEPRPDTETLVEAVLPFVRETAAREGICRILDLGVGTGAIALALLAEVEKATATGVDISADAVATARRNAEALGLGARFAAVQSDWFEKISGSFHLIVANPPYIPTNELLTLQGEVRNFDPAKALDGGADGLDAYRAIASQAGAYLETAGRIAVEIGHTQKRDVTELFLAAGYRFVEAGEDLAGRDRVLIFSGG
jgi:release factor glutamine methyltransferase